MQSGLIGRKQKPIDGNDSLINAVFDDSSNERSTAIRVQFCVPAIHHEFAAIIAAIRSKKTNGELSTFTHFNPCAFSRF
jgi:deoxycytidylate deaminase